ncbi:uncharacterized protein LOC132944688 [Metopolophium dirhodum]|uniref:uncharacterized protein LOC132944688 n=1 Tax=Metopolophium dirhodum TaxID=44670 RepID=UPI00299012B6|nr:uncharacterized protein LOC132944688 [Metopolophium dirhodum]
MDTQDNRHSWDYLSFFLEQGIYKVEGGKAYIFPQDVRWNTLADTIECYLDNWHILYKVCNDNRSAIEVSIFTKIKDLFTKTMDQEYLVPRKKEDLTIGDFYEIWLKCCRDTKKVGSGFSKILSTSMEKREKLLLDNPIFLTGIYLDPRFQCLLDYDSKYKAINILVDVWKMILWLDKNSMPISKDEIIKSATHCEVDNHNFSNVEDDDLEDFIKTKTCISIQEQNESVEAIPIRLLLQSYDNIQRLHHSTSIRQYWQDLKLVKPEIFRLAQVILSVPVTKVSTEHFWIINNCIL